MLFNLNKKEASQNNRQKKKRKDNRFTLSIIFTLSLISETLFMPPTGLAQEISSEVPSKKMAVPLRPTATETPSPNPASHSQDPTSSKNQKASIDYHVPIQINADSAEQNEKEGVTIYRGNVTIRQGNLDIRADTVTIYSSSDNDQSLSHNVTTIVAKGNPASFVQHLATDATTVNAKGNSITYSINEGIILLKDNASIDRHGSKVTGGLIEYFIKEERIKAEAAPDDSTRVHTTIMPSPKPTPKSSAGSTLKNTTLNNNSKIQTEGDNGNS